MKIVYLAAGAGGMYCGTCLHANALASAISKAGHEILLTPVYTPLRTDEENFSQDRVVFGGINVSLQQWSSLFRHTPWFLDRLLDRPALLRRLAGRSSTVQPEGLGALCVSMLKGEQGRQRKELDKLLCWLEEVRPQIVHLSTVLLAGMARQIGRRLGIPVVSALSGEDTFLERLPEPYYAEARAVLRERAADLAALIAPSRSFAGFMADYLALARDRIQVVPLGLTLTGHGPAHVRRSSDGTAGASDSPFTIGYLGRICEEKGLHHLVEAFCLLAHDPQLPPLRLSFAGYLSEADRPCLASLNCRLAEQGLAERFEYVGEVERTEKIEFLQSLNVMCAPSLIAESKGLPVLEAWANGVPVVAPAHGVFPELLEDTDGGLLYEPQNVPALAHSLGRMIQDRAFAAACGNRAREAVCQRYHADLMAQRTLAVYQGILCR